MIQRVLILLLLVTGCQLTPAPTNSATSVPTPLLTTVNATATPGATPNPIHNSTAALQTNLLVWLASGATTSHASGGQIAMLDHGGAVTPLLDVPNTATRVTACGDQAASPDGGLFAFYVGGDDGSLYLMSSAQTPTRIDNVSYLACLNGLRYSPDSQRFAFIDYVAGATRNDYPAGVLRLYNVHPVEEVTEFDNAVAFRLDDKGAVFVSFFANSRGEAEEASISRWDGSAQHEIISLVPTDSDCRFTSAQVGSQGDQLLAVLGQRCKSGDSGTRWQLYTIDTVARVASLVGTDMQPGPFVTFARTNNLYFAPNGSTAYFTVPDAVTAYTVALASVSLSDYSINVPVERQAVFPNFSGASNAFPRLSPEGRWLALVVTSPDNENQVLVLDLNAPDSLPLNGGTHARGDTIPDLAFAPDGQHLLYLAGGVDNALFSLNLASGTEQRIVRGNFAEGLAVAPNGRTVALLNTARVDDPRQPAYLNLVLADLDTASLTMLYPGADVTDGKVNNLRFAYPLAWR